MKPKLSPEAAGVAESSFSVSSASSCSIPFGFGERKPPFYDDSRLSFRFAATSLSGDVFFHRFTFCILHSAFFP